MSKRRTKRPVGAYFAEQQIARRSGWMVNDSGMSGATVNVALVVQRASLPPAQRLPSTRAPS
jgi:hypothetical protein